MDLLVRIARETLPLVHHRFKVEYTGNWYKVAESLIREKQIYGAIEAISGTGNWPMTQNEFHLWQDFFFMSLAEYCHQDEVISLEWPLIRHQKFRENLQFVGSLKKVTRANGRRELIDQLIDSPISERLFSNKEIEKVSRENERLRLHKLFERLDEEERSLAERRSEEIPPASKTEVASEREEKGWTKEESTGPAVRRLKEEDRAPAMALDAGVKNEIPRTEIRERGSEIPKNLRKEEREQAHKEAYQVFKEGKRYELAGNYLKALDSYYYCRQLLVQTPPAKELYGDCMSAIARCTTKLEHKKRMSESELQVHTAEEPGRRSWGYRLFWTSLMLVFSSSIAYGVYVYYGDEIMPYVHRAIKYLSLALERLT